MTPVAIKVTDYEKRDQIDAWCREQFGVAQSIRDPREFGYNAVWMSTPSAKDEREYLFYHEKDAMLFALRWK